MNIGRLIEDNIKRFGEYDFICHNDRWISNADLNNQVNKLGNALRTLGLKKGDRIGVQLPNCPELVQTFYATFKIGGILVPLNPAHKAKDLAYIYKDAGLSALVSVRDYEETIHQARTGVETLKHVIMTGDTQLPEALSLEQITAHASPALAIEETDNNDTAVMIYTAGTTGNPKGVMLTHYNWYSHVTGYYETVLLDAWGVRAKAIVDGKETEVFGIDRNRVSLITLPLFHGYGIFALTLEFLTGGKLVLIPRWNPEDAMDCIEKYKITDFRGVPTMYIQILNHPAAPKYDLSSLKMCICGAAPMPLEVAKEWKQKYGTDIWEGYGLSEATTVNSGNAAERRPPKYGSVGKCYQKANTMSILDDEGHVLPPRGIGEICIKGPAVMKGYWNKPEETAEAIRDGWLHTGDIGYTDEDGYIYITDRKKDLIIRGGENIYPKEIENILHTHPEVLEAGVVGMPDPVYGEAVKAFVALKTPGSVTVEDLMDFCREKLPSYKRPKVIRILDALPKNAVGKILRRELRNLE